MKKLKLFFNRIRAFCLGTHQAEFFLFTLLIFSRFIKGYFFSSFEADEGRDLLIPRHMAFYNEIPKIGHNIGVIKNFNYSINYYFFISLITRLVDNPYFIYFIVAVFAICAGIALYFGTKRLFDKSTARLILFFYIFSPQFIYSINVWGSYCSFYIQIFSFYFFSLFINSRKKLHFLIHLALFGVASSFEFSNAPLLFLYPVFLSKSAKRYLHFLILYSLSFFTLNIDHFMYFKKFYFQIMLSAPLHLTDRFNLDVIISDKFRLFTLIGTNTFNLPLFFCVIFICLIFILYLQKRNHSALATISILSIYIFLFITLSSLLFPNKLWAHHFLGIYLLLYLTISLIISQFSQIAKFIILSLFIVLIFLKFDHGRFKFKMPNYPYNSLKMFDRASLQLDNYLKSRKINHFDLIQNNDNFTRLLPVPELYYFLEKKRGKLININSGTQFNLPEERGMRDIFYICRKYWETTIRYNRYSCERLLRNTLNYAVPSPILREKNIIIYHIERY